MRRYWCRPMAPGADSRGMPRIERHYLFDGQPEPAEAATHLGAQDFETGISPLIWLLYGLVVAVSLGAVALLVMLS